MYFLLIPITGKAMRGSIIKGKPFIKKKKKTKTRNYLLEESNPWKNILSMKNTY
jgi:hypothetical protein